MGEAVAPLMETNLELLAVLVVVPHGEVPVVLVTHHQLLQVKEIVVEVEGHNQEFMAVVVVAVLLRLAVPELQPLVVMAVMERLLVFLVHR
jgi:hypothetical protein